MTLIERNALGSVTRQRDMVLTEIRLEAEGVVSLALEDPERRDLTEWAPGAHIEITLPSGRIRQYSLCGDPDDRKTYRVAVLRVPDGRGARQKCMTHCVLAPDIPFAGRAITSRFSPRRPISSSQGVSA